MFRSLSIPNYRIWFIGALVSNLGVWVQRIAQDWLVLTVLTHNDGLATGITTGLQFLPQLFLAPFAGALSDKYPKRLILLWTQGFMGLTALVQAVLVFSGSMNLPIIYAMALALGIVSAIDAPARQAFVSELVSRDFIANAVSLNSVSFNAARLVGPAISGFLIEGVGIAWGFALNVLTFILMIGALLALRAKEFVAAPPKPSKAASTLRAGFAYVRSRGDVITVITVVTIVSCLALNFQVTIGLMARIAFNEGAADYGLLNTLMAVGSLTGALISARTHMPRIRTIVLSAFGLGLFMLLASMAQNYIQFGITLVGCGYFTLRMLNTANAYLQLTVAPGFRGRVMSIYLAAFLGVAPIGSPLVGWLGTYFGPRLAFVLGALSCLISVSYALIWAARTGRIDLAQMRVRRKRTLEYHVESDENLYAHPETGPITLPIKTQRKRRHHKR